MTGVEKTVFISYRHTNKGWARAIYLALEGHGFDVFLDQESIASGDFEHVILENIRSRAHFIVLLTPSALEETENPRDWVRREIECALDCRRNIVPLTLDGADIKAPSIRKYLTGRLADLARYNVLEVPNSYFDEAMERLRTQYLGVALEAVSHPPTQAAQHAAAAQKAAVAAAPKVGEDERTAEVYFEQGVARGEAGDAEGAIEYYSAAIRLMSDHGPAYSNRGLVRASEGDLQGAMEDHDEAVRLMPDGAPAHLNRGTARIESGDVDGAIADFTESIHLDPVNPKGPYNRSRAHAVKGDGALALEDVEAALRVDPAFGPAYALRAALRGRAGDLEGASDDLDRAIELQPDELSSHLNRGALREGRGDVDGAVADYERFLLLGGGTHHDNQEEIEARIRDLKQTP